MKPIRLNLRGETIAETIIALFVLSIGISVASTVIMNSIRNLTNSKNRVIAVSLALEGIEAVRSIRDTNWLFYSDQRRLCWNHDPSKGTCDGSTPIIPGDYIVYKYQDQSWRLQSAYAQPLVDSNGDGIPDIDPNVIKLSLADIDTVNLDSNGDGDPANDPDFYNHMGASVDHPLGTEVLPTIFSRYVTIEYLPNQPPPPGNRVPPDDSINTEAEWNDPLTVKDELNRMRITSVVIWQQGGASHSTKLVTIITDHLGRTDLKS